MKYKDGLLFAADSSISYGSMMKIKNAKRMCAVGEETILACSGEMSDFQNLQKELDKKNEADVIEGDGATFLHAKDYFNWVARMQYNKRMKSDPIWVTSVIGGINPRTKEVFLGSSDFHGLALEQDYVITGLGNAYCQVLFANRWRADMSREEAVTLIEDCMRVMFFRDKKAHDQIMISTITHEHGVQLGEFYRIEASSDYKSYHEQTNEFYRPMRIRY